MTSTHPSKQKTVAAPQGAAKHLYAALKKIGISDASVDAVLPYWWDHSLADEPAGMTELKVLLARRLSLDPATLFDNTKSIDFLPIVRRYKGGREELMQKLGASTAIASSLCRTALSFIHFQDRARLASDPLALRNEILLSGAKYIGLPELLRACWKVAIPVLHVTLPEKLRKFDALVTTYGDRPGIALCRNEDSEAWLAFHLAHEMGHIACGHLAVDGMLVDEKIESSSLTVQQEQEANEYATKLLGSFGVEPPSLSYNNIPAVVDEFVRHSEDKKILPGHLVLKAGSRDKDFGCARAILTRVEGKTSARKVINDLAHERLAAENWTDEAEEFIMRFSYNHGS